MSDADILQRFAHEALPGRGFRSFSQYTAVANELARRNVQATGLPELRVAILRNVTIETLVPVLAGELFLAGFHPLFFIGEFDAIHADVMNPASAFYAFEPDVVIVAQWLETLSPIMTDRFLVTPAEGRREEPNRLRNELAGVLGALRKHCRAPVLLNNFPLPAEPTLGILDAQSPDYQMAAVEAVNAGVLAAARSYPDVLIVDMRRLFARHGYDNCVDERNWQMARAPFSQLAVVALGVEYAKFVRALHGKAKKCLVLDCDNTLWGGVVGEAGLAGIALGGGYPGSCFVALQREILNLHERGVLLALNSKNNEADVLEVLREHPDMVLREHHFAALQVNWDDKVTNLRRIAQDLNIGLESLVFVDDNPFEVEFVRASLPAVSVVELPPKSYSTYRSVLMRGAFFDSLAFTAEDRRKTVMYRENRGRTELAGQAPSLESYLSELDIEVTIGIPAPVDVPRIAQLTHKTNQFNLTGRRYSEGAVRDFLADGGVEVFALRAQDRIAELGLVGVAILTYAGATATIDTLLLSCRAFGRGIEDALLSAVVEHACTNRHCDRIRARYSASGKNAMVREFLERHGFGAVSAGTAGECWELLCGQDRILAWPAWIRKREAESIAYAGR